MSHHSIVILGGSGKVARRLTSVLSRSNHVVHSVIRKESQIAELKELGATPHVHSIETTSVSDLTRFLRELNPPPTAIVWSAGAGGGDPSRTEAVDFHGAVKAMNAASEANIHRFIMVSANDVRDREKTAPQWYNDEDFQASDRVWGALGPFMKAKLNADKELVQGNHKRGLRWTIVRPGRLLDDEGKGTVVAGRVHLGTPVSRSDVADVVAECLKDDGTVGLAFDVMGGDTPIERAVKHVVNKREDCFQDFM